MVLIDSNNSYTTDSIIKYYHHHLASSSSSSSSSFSSTCHLLSNLMIVKVFDPWSLLNALSNIKENHSLILIDSLHSLMSPYLLPFILKPTNNNTLVPIEPSLESILAQLAITFRYLNATFQTSIIVHQCSRLPVNKNSANDNTSCFDTSAYVEAIDYILYCREINNDEGSQIRIGTKEYSSSSMFYLMELNP